MFPLQLFAGDVLARNRVFRSVFDKQSGRLDRNFRARDCGLDIRNIRNDLAGRCLLYAERFVLNRSMDGMRVLIEECANVNDS